MLDTISENDIRLINLALTRLDTWPKVFSDAANVRKAEIRKWDMEERLTTETDDSERKHPIVSDPGSRWPSHFGRTQVLNHARLSAAQGHSGQQAEVWSGVQPDAQRVPRWRLGREQGEEDLCQR
jgi:hypothetical protein